MFNKILIANRGEIACRVIKTAQKMGIATVAVYSDADRNALHVQMADEAVHIGPPPANQSYIVIDRIMDAVRQTGARGGASRLWLPVREHEVRRGAGSGGRRLHRPAGSARSRRWATRSPPRSWRRRRAFRTVPGHMGLIADADEAVKIAGEIGYPVMIKASAGGGGKGMRIAWNDDEAREGFQSSKNEAANSFGDDRIFIEKFVTQPRHIEIQVLADKHGNCVYLHERECSIQRRNQKVIEEAPSPVPRRRRPARRWASRPSPWRKAVGYTSAGTVEFIVDGDRNFYFLEMNTRLAGRTSGDRTDHRHRPGRADDPRGRRREAALCAGRSEDQRLGDRKPALCRRSLPQLPALDRAADPLPPAGGRARRDGRRRAQRYRRLRGRRDQHVLRPDDRQALHLGARPAPQAIEEMRLALDSVRGRRDRAQPAVPVAP